MADRDAMVIVPPGLLRRWQTSVTQASELLGAYGFPVAAAHLGRIAREMIDVSWQIQDSVLVELRQRLVQVEAVFAHDLAADTITDVTDDALTVCRTLAEILRCKHGRVPDPRIAQIILGAEEFEAEHGGRR